MSLQLPEGMDPAMMAAGGAPPAPPLPQGLEDDQPTGDPLGCLKDVIDDFPRLLTELQDPRDVQDAVKALQILAGIQTRLMSGGPSGPQGS